MLNSYNNNNVHDSSHIQDQYYNNLYTVQLKTRFLKHLTFFK